MFNYYWISASSAKAVRCSSSDDVFTTRMYRRVLDEMHGLESNRWKSESRDGWSQTEQSEYGSGHSGVPEGSSIGSVSQSGRPPARLLYNVTQAANTLCTSCSWNRDITATIRTALSKAHTCANCRWCRKIVTTEQMPDNTSSHVEHGGTPSNRNGGTPT